MQDQGAEPGSQCLSPLDGGGVQREDGALLLWSDIYETVLLEREVRKGA